MDCNKIVKFYVKKCWAKPHTSKKRKSRINWNVCFWNCDNVLWKHSSALQIQKTSLFHFIFFKKHLRETYLFSTSTASLNQIRHFHYTSVNQAKYDMMTFIAHLVFGGYMWIKGNFLLHHDVLVFFLCSDHDGFLIRLCFFPWYRI